MPLNVLGVESFDGGTAISHFGSTTATATRKTYSIGTFAGSGIVTGFTGQGLKSSYSFQPGDDLSYAGHATWVVVYRVKKDAVSFGGDGWASHYYFEEGSSNQLFVFEYRNDGAIYARHGNVAQDNNGLLLEASAAGVLSPNTWHLIESRVTIADAGGAWNLKVDGVQVLNGTGDTRPLYTPSTGLIKSVRLGSWSGNVNTIIDDVLIADGAGSTTDYPGAIRIYSRVPVADVEVDGTPTPAGSVYTTVDETAQDDSDYSLLDTAGDTDLFDFAALGVTGTVVATQLTYRCAWANAAGSSAAVAKLSGTESEGSSRASPSDNLNTFGEPQKSQVWTEKPGGGAWTVTDVDNATFGVRRL